MKERPIIIDAESVRAILDGRKTQTRRVIEPQPILYGNRSEFPGHWAGTDEQTFVHVTPASDGTWRDNSEELICPFGDVGDRLWVRETFGLAASENTCVLSMARPPYPTVLYKATAEPCDPAPTPAAWYRSHSGESVCLGYWRSPLHMPRWASRITLEITGVRVERLQEITEADAQAEGWDLSTIPPLRSYDPVVMRYAREWYSARWVRLNAKRGHPWESNPWVWVLEFRRVEP